MDEALFVCGTERVGHLGGDGQEAREMPPGTIRSASDAPRTSSIVKEPDALGLVDRVVISWPGGRTEEFKAVKTGQRYRCVEESGIVWS